MKKFQKMLLPVFDYVPNSGFLKKQLLLKTSVSHKGLVKILENRSSTRQVIDIPVIKPVYTAHRVYRRTCSCGHSTQSNFPAYIAAKEFFTDVMGLPVSVGGIHNILKRLTQKALPHYQQIKERLYGSVFIGTD